jgi:hypothetical protein
VGRNEARARENEVGKTNHISQDTRDLRIFCIMLIFWLTHCASFFLWVQ